MTEPEILDRLTAILHLLESIQTEKVATRELSETATTVSAVRVSLDKLIKDIDPSRGEVLAVCWLCTRRLYLPDHVNPGKTKDGEPVSLCLMCFINAEGKALETETKRLQARKKIR
jgi:hypothetical protein